MKRNLLSFIIATMTATTLAAAPQAIVFDFGGVLTGEQNREAVVRFLQESFDLSREEFEKINQEKRLAVKQGKTDEEFWIGFAKEKSIALPVNWVDSLKSVMKEAIGVNPEMYALVEELRGRHIPIALLSNIDERLSKLIRDFGLYDPFNPCLLSCEIGIEKPDPKAYEFLLAKLNLPAQEVLFIDDRIENVEAAKKMEIDTLLFESPEQLRMELIKRELLNTKGGVSMNIHNLLQAYEAFATGHHMAHTIGNWAFTPSTVERPAVDKSLPNSPEYLNRFA